MYLTPMGYRFSYYYYTSITILSFTAVLLPPVCVCEFVWFVLFTYFSMWAELYEINEMMMMQIITGH